MLPTMLYGVVQAVDKICTLNVLRCGLRANWIWGEILIVLVGMCLHALV
jgi:hypothetical protein